MKTLQLNNYQVDSMVFNFENTELAVKSVQHVTFLHQLSEMIYTKLPQSYRTETLNHSITNFEREKLSNKPKIGFMFSFNSFGENDRLFCVNMCANFRDIKIKNNV